MANYTPIIGLEVHVELKTASKMFCGCDAQYFGQKPNTHCCPVCLGLPGALPVPNKKAIEWCIQLGLALNCEIPLHTKFDRKNYFYPDLPKGYQISQYDQPLAHNGWLEISLPSSKQKKIRIRRVHMEEDTGKLMHATSRGNSITMVDFNRSGVPLVEIVTEPDFRSSDEAREYLKQLHRVVRRLGISDADMEKGSMRMEPNISVQVSESTSEDTEIAEKDLPTYKVEVKNINSFSFAKKAIDYEVNRHIEMLKQGIIPDQETRGWNEQKAITVSQRSKEEAHDYRYFPEPDIPPMVWTEDAITSLKKQLPELPNQTVGRLKKDFGLAESDAVILSDDPELFSLFQQTVDISNNQRDRFPVKNIANRIINKKASQSNISPQTIIDAMQEEMQAKNIDEQTVLAAIEKVCTSQIPAVNEYRNGKSTIIMFLVGQVIRELHGKGNAQQIRSLLEQKLAA